jgi:hypothetical protein
LARHGALNKRGTNGTFCGSGSKKKGTVDLESVSVTFSDLIVMEFYNSS